VVEIVIRPAFPADAHDLAPRMRAADVAEVWASHRLSPVQALENSLRLSSHAWAGLADGVLVCLWGACPASFINRIGVPWLLGSDEVEAHQTTFLRRSLPALREMQSVYRILKNHVDARNRASIRWLRWLGFTVHPAQPFGPDGVAFHPFEWRSA
jgi:hypothetical protein